MNVRETQQLIMKNKLEKGFNVSDIPLEICLMQGEMTEFFQAWRKNQDDVGEELADVAIYMLGLAEMLGIDLEREIDHKIRKNADREYVRVNGTLIKTGN